MSAYIISNATMDRIITAIMDDEYNKPFPQYDLKTQHGRNELGEHLFEMNQQAIEARYQDRCDPLEGKYIWREFCSMDLVEAYKAIQNLLYQCSEGDVPERDTFKTLERYGGQVAERCVRQTVAWNAAPWGDREDASRNVG